MTSIPVGKASSNPLRLPPIQKRIIASITINKKARLRERLRSLKKEIDAINHEIKTSQARAIHSNYSYQSKEHLKKNALEVVKLKKAKELYQGISKALDKIS